MNTTARRLTPVTLTTLSTAVLAALFMLHDSPTVVMLEPVHVTGQRAPAATVVQAPLVEVVARRADARAVQVSQVLNVVQLPRVEVTAQRSADPTRATRVAQQRPAAVPARNPA
jgi:hypothetical protein